MAENANELSQLTDTKLLDELENLASKLEDAWKKGGAVDMSALLPAAASPLRKHALVELIKVDLECRWRRGQPVVLDYYLDKFPDLGRPRDLPAKLIFEEYRVRHLWGDKPPLTLYQARFPTQFEQLQRFLNDEPLPTVAHVATAVKSTGEKKNVSKTEPVEPTAPGAQGGFKDNTQQMGEYRMIERLGAGAFGEVWKVELPGGIMKAVKIIFRPLDHEEAQRELESLKLIQGLRHHFLLQTISYKPSGDRLRILMDLADCSLRDLLKKSKKEGKSGLPLQDNVKWLRQAAEALDYLHERKMHHRDIKPENILLSEGNVRVADFGLARVQQTARLASMSGAGTPLYMPPETWNDKQHANSDQYSLAATYAECRLGRRIYESDGIASLMQAHVHDKPKLDPLPPEEQKVLLKALAKNPAHRYSSCMAFADDLTNAVAKLLRPGSIPGLSLVNVETSTGGRRARQKQKQLQTTFLVAGIVALLVMAAIIVSLWLPRTFLPTAAAGKFRPVAGAEVVTIDGKQFYKQIECQLNGNPELAVRFNLIPWPEKGGKSFYLMEDKVSNDVYRLFANAKENSAAVNGSRWQLGARSDIKPDWPADVYPAAAFYCGSTMQALNGGPPFQLNFAAIRVLFYDSRQYAVFWQEDWPQPQDLGAQIDRWPVLRVDIQESHRCAEWLGGVLPSVEQWDKAAGRFESNRGDGPYEAPFKNGEIAVGGESGRPMPVGSSIKDICKFSGCRDMSGNGFEWTRTIRNDGEQSEYFGDVSRVPPLGKVPLRGRSYKDQEPLTYAVLDERPVDLEFFQKARNPGYDSFIGFRVALMP